MKMCSKVLALARNPTMAAAYIRWIATRLALGRSPRRQLTSGPQVGEWLTFSEYWGFRECIPNRELLFVNRALAFRPEGQKVAIDIGANVGLFSCYFASMSARVHAFEPVADTFCRLKKNMKFNRLSESATLNCLAVGQELSLVPFSVDDRASATNRMLIGEPSRRKHWVASVSLDEYLHREGISVIDLLKIDVEGMEPYVLRGARSALKRKAIKFILIEVCPVNLRSVGLSVSLLAEEIRQVPYTAYALDADGYPTQKLTEEDLSSMELANVALLPDT